MTVAPFVALIFAMLALVNAMLAGVFLVQSMRYTARWRDVGLFGACLIAAFVFMMLAWPDQP